VRLTDYSAEENPSCFARKRGKIIESSKGKDLTEHAVNVWKCLKQINWFRLF
jgi:hypothetical protein